jgi:drug/metabolite transporter (DMT)-like permease
MIGELAALSAAVSWAIAPTLYKKALLKTTPISANIFRCVSNVLILTLALFAIGGFSTLAMLPPEILAIVALSGIIGLGLGDTLYMFGLKSVGVSRAVPLAATYPLFSLLWSILLGEALALSAVVGALVILFGIWLLSSQRTSGKFLDSRVLTKGVVASLATAILWSVSVTLMDVAVSHFGTSGLNANFAIVVLRLIPLSIFLLAFSPLIDKNKKFLKMDRSTAILLCVGGLVANGIGWVLMNVSFMNIVGSRAIPISSTTPLFSALAGFLLFYEKATVENAVGAFAVVVGVSLIFLV